MKIKSTYDKAKKRASYMQKIHYKVYSGEITNKADRKFYAVVNNPFKYTIEFDQLKNEFPDTFRIYLQQFLQDYEYIKTNNEDYKTDNKEFRLDPPNSQDSKMKDIQLSMFEVFSYSLDVIIKHLTELLTPEAEAQESTKPTAQPKGQTQLNRNQTGLLFWYLREKSLIAPKAENQYIAKAIELMSGHSAGIMADILKKPGSEVCKLGKDDKTVNKTDFDIVIDELEKMIKRIKKDRLINLDNGELN